jgi:hypothetical protein
MLTTRPRKSSRRPRAPAAYSRITEQPKIRMRADV